MTPADLQRLLAAVRADPSARDELRRAILTEDVLSVPSRMDRVEQALERLAMAQERTEERLSALAGRADHLEQALERLAAAQERTEERLNGLVGRVDHLEQALERLAAAQERTEERLNALVGRVDGIEATLVTLAQRMDALVEAQRRTEAALGALAESTNRRLSHLESMAGTVFEPQLGRRVSGLLASVDLRVTPVAADDLAFHFQRLGASQEDLSLIIDRPDWHGIARRNGGAALVLAEASLTGAPEDVDRLEAWREAVERHEVPVIVVLVARKRSSLLPPPDELRRRRIAWAITDNRERGVPEPALGDFAV